MQLDDIRKLAQAAKGNINKIYIHWTAGHYGQQFNDYHILVDKDGSLYATVDDLTTHLNHTYMRNTGAVAIGVLCAYQAHSTDNLGEEPPTDAQIEAIAQVIAVLAEELEINIDIQHVMTHAEAANNLDGYNPGYEDNGCVNGIYGPTPKPDGSPGGTTERWDFLVVKAGDKLWSGGDTLRGKAIYYLNH